MSTIRDLLEFQILIAYQIGLLDVKDINMIHSYFNTNIFWNENWSTKTRSDIEKFNKALVLLQHEFGNKWRWIASAQGRNIVFYRVICLRNLSFILNDVQFNPRITPLIKKFNSQKNILELNYHDIDSKTKIEAIEKILGEIKIEVVDRARFTPFLVKTTALHPPGSCWTSNSIFHPKSAQNYRDKLGLWHYPNSSKIGDQLIALKFSAKISTAECPKIRDPSIRDRASGNTWLLRPTLADMPNIRFSQGHSKDQKNKPSLKGKTINIRNEKYKEGGDEHVLLAGLNTKVEWKDIDLLDGGPPRRYKHDDEHEKFIQILDNRLSILR